MAERRFDPGDSDVLYAPTVGHGAFKSADGGQHWSPMPALTPQAIWTLALDPANSQVLYAGTNEDGVWKSTDAGNTWRQAGSPGSFPVYSLTVDPSAAHVPPAARSGMPGRRSDARLSQDGPAISGAPKTATARITAQKLVGIFIILPFISIRGKKEA
jgi:hypothetical protein